MAGAGRLRVRCDYDDCADSAASCCCARGIVGNRTSHRLAAIGARRQSRRRGSFACTRCPLDRLFHLSQRGTLALSPCVGRRCSCPVHCDSSAHTLCSWRYGRQCNRISHSAQPPFAGFGRVYLEARVTMRVASNLPVNADARGRGAMCVGRLRAPVTWHVRAQHGGKS